MMIYCWNLRSYPMVMCMRICSGCSSLGCVSTREGESFVICHFACNGTSLEETAGKIPGQRGWRNSGKIRWVEWNRYGWREDCKCGKNIGQDKGKWKRLRQMHFRWWWSEGNIIVSLNVQALKSPCNHEAERFHSWRQTCSLLTFNDAIFSDCFLVNMHIIVWPVIHAETWSHLFHVSYYVLLNPWALAFLTCTHVKACNDLTGNLCLCVCLCEWI